MEADSFLPELFSLIIWGVILGLPFVIFFCSGLVGGMIERRNYHSIQTREAATAGLPTVTGSFLESDRPVADARLVMASVVISQNYCKRFLARYRKGFGSQLNSYEALLDRARREAVLRLKAQCPDAHVVLNLRLEVTHLANANDEKDISALEVIAYGTAVRYAS